MSSCGQGLRRAENKVRRSRSARGKTGRIDYIRFRSIDNPRGTINVWLTKDNGRHNFRKWIADIYRPYNFNLVFYDVKKNKKDKRQEHKATTRLSQEYLWREKLA